MTVDMNEGEVKEYLCSLIVIEIDKKSQSLRKAAEFTGISHAQIVAIRKRKIAQISIKSLVEIAERYGLVATVSIKYQISIGTVIPSDE